MPVRLSESSLAGVLHRRFPICYGEILVELKALHAIGPIETAQLINYLRVAGPQPWPVLNSRTTSLQHKRLVVDLAGDFADQSGDQ